MTTVLVVGATGHVGRPVAHRLLADGRSVRVLVRDPARARELLGEGFDYVSGAIDDPPAVAAAVEGCDGVHVSVAGTTAADMMTVEGRGTAAVAEAARAAGVKLITYVSGNLVREDYGPKVAEHVAKIAAEDALRASGVPTVIFRPTYFMENLPRHVQGRLAVTMGRPQPLHMVAGADFGALVSKAYDVPGAANRELVVYGPEALTIQDALQLYRDILRPDLHCVTVPLPLMTAVNRVVLRGKLSGPLVVMGLLQRMGECGNPAITEQLLGNATTTVREWCLSRLPDPRTSEPRKEQP